MNVFAPVAIFGFWGLLVAGYLLDELHPRGTAIFVLLWLAGFIGSRYTAFGALFLPYVAVLDILLVLVVFKGDVTLK
jgi:hypothetical protein